MTPPDQPKSYSFGEVVQMNRHARRRLGKENGVKIPSAKNLKKKPVNAKKIDDFFKKLPMQP